METPHRRKNARLGSLIPFVMVLLISLVLLIYIGIGDANRVYTKFHVNKVAALGQIVTDSIETFCNSGFPLRHYVGFEEFTTPLLESEKTIARLEAATTKGEIVFSVRQPSLREAEGGGPFAAASSLVPEGEKRYTVGENGAWYRIAFALESKFGAVGTLSVYTPKNAVTDKVIASFLPVWIAAAGVLAAFTLALVLLFRRSGRGAKIGIQVCFAAAFVILSAFSIVALVRLYTDGIKDKSQALATSLSKRLNMALSLNLSLSQFSGIDEVFDDYKKIDPDISYLSLSQHGVILLHTDRARIRAPEREDERLFEIRQPLGAGRSDEPDLFVIGMGIPKDRMYEQLLRSGKNFIVLLFSTLFLSVLFLNLLFGIRRKAESEPAALPEAANERRLELVKPIYFLTTFLEALFVSFLPLYFQQVAAQSRMDPATAPILFTIYFAAFVVSLLPAGRLAERSGIKGLLAGGAVLMTASYALLFLFPDFYLIVVSRVLAGLGQGVVFIGVQSYIFRTVSRERRTQGSGIIVFGYNGGMISGTAIGALLVGSLGMRGVFVIATVMSLLILVYILVFVPGLARVTAAAPTPGASRLSPARNLFRVLGDIDFITAIVCVGIVAKAVLTGVNGFALPLILNKMNYLKEDIGQIIILYSAAVLVSSGFISRIIDRFGNVRRFLFLGTQIGGLALYAMGFAGWDALHLPSLPFLNTAVLVAGTLLLGFGHGFIHAPIMTHVTEIRAARLHGAGFVSSLYRFLERIGHVAGPMVIGPILYGMNFSSFALSWIGVFSLAAGIVFIAFRGKATVDAGNREN